MVGKVWVPIHASVRCHGPLTASLPSSVCGHAHWRQHVPLASTSQLSSLTRASLLRLLRHRGVDAPQHHAGRRPYHAPQALDLLLKLRLLTRHHLLEVLQALARGLALQLLLQSHHRVAQGAHLKRLALLRLQYPAGLAALQLTCTNLFLDNRLL